MMTLTYHVDRTIVIQATPAIVFGFLTDTPRWAAWWGAGSEIDARPGGLVKIRYPDGTEAMGEVTEVRAPERIAFTYGYASGKLIPPGGSRVTIELEPVGAATRLRLTHEVADETVRDEHVQGWRYQLSLFANVVADAVNTGAAGVVDAWFDAWADPDVATRTATLSSIAVPGLRSKDRFSNTEGLDDLVAHISGAQRFMPGIRMSRSGSVRHCQGTVLADWTATGADGQPRGRGTSVFLLGGDGRVESVTGFWTLT